MQAAVVEAIPDSRRRAALVANYEMCFEGEIADNVSVSHSISATAFVCYVAGFAPIWIPRASAALHTVMSILRDSQQDTC